jgi:MFS family permease
VALSLLGDQMLYAVLPVMHEAVGVPVVAVGLLLSANRWVRLLTNTLAVQVLARYGRQWPFVLALVLGGLTTIAYGVLHGVWVFLAARLLWGTAWSFIRIEGLSTVLDVAAEGSRGRYMGLYQAISRLGGAVAMLAGGVLTDVIGFRATFVLFGSCTCASALLAHYEMRQRRVRDVARTTGASATAAAPSPRQQAQGQEDRTTWGTDRDTRWRMAAASFATFSTFVIGALVSATLGYTLRHRFGTTLTVGSLAVGVASLTGLLLSSRGFLDLGFAPFAGYLADRWGRHRMIFATMPVAILSVAVLAIQPPLLVVIGAVLLLYAAGAAGHVALDAVAGDIAPAGKRRMFLSLFVTWQDLGAATGPLLGYWIGPQFGLFWLYLSGASLLLAATVVYLVTFVEYTPRPVPASDRQPV